MKNAWLAPVFCACAVFAGYSQSEMKEAAKLYDANYNMDFDAVAALTYPKVVEQLGGRDAFITKLDADYQNKKYRKRLQLTAPVFQLNPAKTIKGRKFCVVLYRNPTRIFYEDKLSPQDMESEVAQWKKIAGTNEVFAEPNRNSINVKRVSKFVAVLDETTAGQWKFFNLDDIGQAQAFDALFGSEKSGLGL